MAGFRAGPVNVMLGGPRNSIPRIESPKEINMRPEHNARRAIIREWMSLPRDKRATEEQAAAFAMKAIEKHEFRYSGDRRQRIMAWLLPRIKSRSEPGARAACASGTLQCSAPLQHESKFWISKTKNPKSE